MKPRRPSTVILLMVLGLGTIACGPDGPAGLGWDGEFAAANAQLELNSCPDEGRLYWRFAIGLQEDADLDQELPNWPGQMSASITGTMGDIGMGVGMIGLGRGFSHLSCHCTHGICPCDEAMDEGAIEGWQILGDAKSIPMLPRDFDIGLSLSHRDATLLPRMLPGLMDDAEASQASGLRLRYQLSPASETESGECHPIPVLAYKTDYSFYGMPHD